MFSRDISHERMRTPRTLNDAFGPYAKLYIVEPRRRFAAVFWMLAYGIGIGVAWWLLVAIKAGA